jgi:hypothetical protein
VAPLSKRVLFLAALGLGAACGTTVGPGDGTVTLRITAPPIPTDTIETELRDPLVVTLRSGQDPVVGISIRILAGGQLYTENRPPFLWIRQAPPQGTDPSFHSSDLSLSTDAHGEVRLLAKRGWYAGKGYLIASVPVLGIADSVPFEIQPGSAHRITISPGDTAILIGAGYQLTAAAVDRVDNPVPAAATVATDSTAITIGADGLISANRLGRANLRVTVAGQQLSAAVSIVPAGVIAGAHPNRIVVSRTDGAAVGWSSTPVPVQPFGVTWMRRADSLAFELGGAIYVADSTGHLSRLFQQQIVTEGEKWPQFFRNEEALLLTSGQSVWRVNLTTLLAENLTSSFFPQDLRASPGPSGGQAVVTRSGQLSIMLFGSHVVTSLGVSGFGGRWAPDGSQIAYLDFGEAPWLIRPDGTGARRVQSGGRFFQDFDWSPDGKWLVASGGHPDYGFFLLEVNGTLVLPLPHTKGMRYPAWRP